MSSNSHVCHGVMHPLVLPPKQDLTFPYRESQRNSGAWDFILDRKSNKYNGSLTTNGPDQVCVHPLSRGSVSSPTKRSLEMCTESLGSETGTYIDSIMDEFSHPASTRPSTAHQKTLALRKRNKHVTIIPPPLTTIRHCVHLLQVHREDGRLVIKASRFSSCRTCFKSERGNGRLRLSLIKDECIDRHPAENPDDAAEFNVSERSEADSNGSGKVGGKLGLGSRCNGDDHHHKTLPSFPIYVAMSCST